LFLLGRRGILNREFLVPAIFNVIQRTIVAKVSMMLRPFVEIDSGKTICGSTLPTLLSVGIRVTFVRELEGLLCLVVLLLGGVVVQFFFFVFLFRERKDKTTKKFLLLLILSREK